MTQSYSIGRDSGMHDAGVRYMFDGKVDLNCELLVVLDRIFVLTELAMTRIWGSPRGLCTFKISSKVKRE